MAACPKCGSIVPDGASFCSVCGSRVSVAGAPVAPPPPPPPQASAGVGMTSNVAGALAYLPYIGLIIGIIFLVSEPYKRNRFVRFHAVQSICLAMTAFIFWVIWSNFLAMAIVTFGILWAFFGMIGSLVYLAFFVLWLFLMYKAYNNEMFKLPVIGDIAEKQAAK